MRFVASLVLAVSATPAVFGVINPALQPDVYFDSYDNVLVLELGSIDAENAALNFTVAETLKGDYAAGDAVTLTFVGAFSDMVAQTRGQWNSGGRRPFSCLCWQAESPQIQSPSSSLSGWLYGRRGRST